MSGGISGVGTGPVVTQPTDVQQGSSTQATDSGTQVEQALGSAPRTPVAARESARQTVPARPLASLRGTGTGGAPTDAGRTRQAQARARAGLPKQLGITVPPASSAVSLDSRMIAREIQGLPRSQRAGARVRAGETLQARVNNGFKVYQDIQAGRAATPAASTDIRDFMTFLTARAGQKSAYFANGAFNLPDPGNSIRDFLDSSAEVYQRSSTHIDGFSSHEGCGHRGIDMDLPHGMGTLLYGGMKDGVMGTRGDRIFLKMESHGCRISTLAQDQVDRQGPVSRPKRFLSDLLTSIKHGWGGLKTLLGLQKTHGTRKERLDKGVERGFKALVEKARTSGIPGLADALNLDDPAGKRTGHGIRTMMKNINSILDLEKLPAAVRERMEMEALPQDLRTELTAFKGQLESRYDHVEHRIGNEIVFDTDELSGTGNAKETMRDGQARSLVSQLLGVKEAKDLKPDDIKGLITTMYSLGSTIDGEGKDDRVDQKDSALTKAVSGLSDEQRTHLREILTSDTVQDLANEFQDRAMGMEFDLPGHTLDHQQELNVRGLMADSMETLNFLIRAVGAEPRTDGEYAESQLEGLTDTLFDITDALSEPRSREQIHSYLSGVEIKDRSALQLKALAGDGNMVVGTSARAMFGTGLPQVDSSAVNAKAKELVEDQLTHPGDLETEGLAGEIGMPASFMKDFKRQAVVVNGEAFGGPGTDIGQALRKFTDALGGREQALTASRLLSQEGDKVSEVSHFLHTGEAGMQLGSGQMGVIAQDEGQVPAKGTRSITVNEDGSAVIRLRHSKGGMDQVTYNSEVGILLSGLTGEVTVDDVQVAMVFTSND